MLADSDRKTILKISERYKAKRVILFGSSLKPNIESNDIDIAVEGINPKDFFNYYGDLITTLSKPIDVVELSTNSKFNHLIQQEGELLYGHV